MSVNPIRMSTIMASVVAPGNSSLGRPGTTLINTTAFIRDEIVAARPARGQNEVGDLNPTPTIDRI